MKCPNCNRENKNTNIRCEYCNTELITLEEDKHIEPQVINIDLNSKKTKIIFIFILLFIFGPSFFFASISTGVGAYIIASENKGTENYLKTEATLIDSNYNCSEVGCKALYEFEVNNIKYKASPDLYSNNFAKTATVKYNPNNPNENMMRSNGESFLRTGIIIQSIIIILLILIIIIYRKLAKASKKDNEKKA